MKLTAVDVYKQPPQNPHNALRGKPKETPQTHTHARMHTYTNKQIQSGKAAHRPYYPNTLICAHAHFGTHMSVHVYK